MFFRLDSFESRFNCSFFTTISWKTFYLTLFLKSQNYLFVFFFIQFPMTFLSGDTQCTAGGLKLCRVTLRFSAYTSYKHSETSFTSLSPRSSRCLVGSSGVEPPTSCLSGMRSNLLSYEPILELPVGFLHLSSGGDEGIRTLDPLLAGQVLSQLSYTPSRVFFQTVSEDKTTTSKSFGHLSVSLIRIGSCSSNITDSP